MKIHDQDNVKKNKSMEQWYKSAVTTATIGAIFTFVVTIVLLFNFMLTSIIRPGREQELVNLKQRIQNETDIEEIRKLDLEIRRSWLRSPDFNQTGAFLLLAGLVTVLIGYKSAGLINKKLPQPQAGLDRLKEQIQDAKFSRWSITTGLIVLVFLAFLLAIKPGIAFFQIIEVDTSIPTEEEIARNVPRFRGPGGLGVSFYENMPEHWDGETGEGILWKTPVPLPGKNSPIVWEDHVFIAGGDANEICVFCFDANTGQQVWTGHVNYLLSGNIEEPFEIDEFTGYAASTMVTDGRRVYVISPAGIVASFDFSGNKIWQKNLGVPDSAYGYATSLAMYQNLVLIQYDQGLPEDEKSALIALNSVTGDISWQKPRPVGSSWSSPIVVKIEGQYQLITSSEPWVISYNPEDGTELWRVNCLSYDIAPSPIYANEMVIIIDPPSRSMIAIRPDGRGDVTKTHVAWSVNCDAPDICSPVGNSELIFLAKNTYLTCHKIADGSELWFQNLREFFTASPGLVGNKLYLLSDEGSTFIIEAGIEYKEPIICELGERVEASPAFMDGRIYIRGEENLYCIGQ